MEPSVVDLVRDLYASPPDEFVAARNALVRSLKRDGDRAAADVVRVLRRPSWIDGALDRVARDRPDLVAAFVDAATIARRIQDDDAQGRRTASLPDALRAVRAAQTELATAADAALVESGRKADLPGVRARLGQLTTDTTSLDLLAAGVLGLDHDDLVEAFTAGDRGDRSETDGGPGADHDEGLPDATDAADEAERRRAIEVAARDARSAAKDAAVAVTASRRASERRDRAEAAVEAAAASVRAAQEALARAEADLAEHERRAAAAHQAAEEATAAAEAAATLLADLDE